MSLRGTLRSVNAAANRYEREQKRKQRELEKRKKLLDKLQEQERAALEVEELNNYIELLQTMHKDCGGNWNWQEISGSSAPAKPPNNRELEIAAKAKLDHYKPSVSDRLLGRIENRKIELADEISLAKQDDEKNFQEVMELHKREHEDWENLIKLAKSMLKNDSSVYLSCIEQLLPFEELHGLGSAVSLTGHDGKTVLVELVVNSEQVVPQEQKSLLKSGKLSVKQLPKSKFYEIYQDYVCSALIRIARELFAFLPVEWVMATATASLLDTKTGHLEDKPILSVAFPRKTIESLNFERIDPSDSLDNFVHNVNFKKTKGFSGVKRLNPEDIEM